MTSTILWSLDKVLKVNFGQVSLNNDQIEWFNTLNKQIPALCRQMPAGLQTTAIMTIQKYYTKYKLQNLLQFFAKFYAPTWTILYWLQEEHQILSAEEINTVLKGQAMAMFLHMLDDHLTDGHLHTDHLLLQLRTEAWTRYKSAVNTIASTISGGNQIADELISSYFSAIYHPPLTENYADYCNLFRKQIGTGLVLPILVAHRAAIDVTAMRSAYEDFCVAWRLLDDLRDCVDDALEGEKSSLSFFMASQDLWEACAGKEQDSSEWQILTRYLEKQVFAPFIGEIYGFLSSAESTAQRIGLAGYANEFRQLSAAFA